MADADSVALREDFSRKSGVFANLAYSVLSTSKPGENIVFSPFSIQTCAAMARIGAEGETAAEMDRGLNLVSSDVNRIGGSFHEVLAAYEKSNVLRIANKIYVMQGYTVKQAFNDILTKNFFSSADSINFAHSDAAAKTINDWVESKTNNLIKDLVQPSALDAMTRLVLLNAIHFKGTWVHKFPKEATHNEPFYMNEVDSVEVPMMRLKERFRYADLPELDATALEMRYKDTDLSMLVILPNSRTGLANLEEKMKSISLADISEKMSSTQVIVKFPKFKAEFAIELNDAFKKMGMTRMFGGNAEFGQMLDSDEQLYVSKIIHKAFIEVNEEGTEAAAATGMSVRKKRCIMELAEPREFEADHPFFYVINRADEQTQPNSSISLFMGSITTFNVAKQHHNEL